VIAEGVRLQIVERPRRRTNIDQATARRAGDEDYAWET
jgi:hypothetical protein